MSNTIKNILFVVAGVIVGLLFATMFSSNGLGGVYSNVTKDFSEGISVDGTVVIDGSGNIDAPITSSTGTFSSTLSVTGASTFTGDVGAGVVITDELTQGGSVLATSTVGTATTFAVSDLLTYSTWEVTPNTADLTYTFPASSTLSTIVPNAGDSRTWQIYNATSTAGIDVIFAAGTGSEIKGAGGGSLTIDEASFGSFTVTRKANSDITIITNFPTAD